ncbi:MAG TPA: DUF4340 domain-containing protein [Candidatus Acidoferrum sp.]|nr:DUF4340 domain-containing protein [Candidatus Acidoferrum sp.]
MKINSLLIAAIVLAALSGVLYWSNHKKTSANDVKVSSDVPPKILSLTQSDITKLAIKQKGKDDIDLDKNDAGKWQIAGAKPLRADQDTVSGVLSTLSSLDSERLIEAKAANLSEFGLAQPSAELDVTEKDDKTQKLLIGDSTPTGNAVYVALAGDPRVFTVENYNKTSLVKNENDLRDKRLLFFDQDKLTGVQLQAKKADIEFARNKEQWQIVKPKPYRAEDSNVQDLIRKLADARMDLTVPEDVQKKAAASFAAGTPVAVAKVTDNSGTEELQVRKNKDDYYAKSSAVDGAYKVGSDLGLALDKGVDDFRTKKLFNLGFTDPDKIEFHDGAKTYFLTKGGMDWWLPDGKKADAIDAESFEEKVRDLSASKFVESGFTTPAMELIATSNKGKTVEKVLISKNGDRYIAKRDDGSALYEISPSDVTSMEKAAVDMKPAVEPKPATKPKK